MTAALYLAPTGHLDQDRQQAVCLTICQRRGLRPVAICHTVSDASRLLRDGTARMVVAAMPDPDLTMRCAGRIAYLRPAPQDRTHHRRRFDLGTLVHRWANKGMDVEEIAELLDEPAEEIRRELGRPCRVRIGRHRVPGQRTAPRRADGGR